MSTGCKRGRRLSSSRDYSVLLILTFLALGCLEPVASMMMPLGSFVRNLKLIELCLPVSQGGSTCKTIPKGLDATSAVLQLHLPDEIHVW